MRAVATTVVLAARLLAVLAFVRAGPARAGSLYKCSGEHGRIVYTGNTSGYSQCHRLASYTEVAQPAPAPGQSVYRDKRQGKAVAGPTVVRHAGKSGSVRISRGTVYKASWDHDHSIPLYTNVKPDGKYTVLFHYVDTCYACDVHSAIDWGSVALNLTAFRNEIDASAAEFGIQPSLLRALIHAESAFDPDAKSNKGAQGLTQLMPATAASLGVDNAWDAAQNIRGGARYLARLLHDFHGDVTLATAAYNAGESAVRKYHGVPPYPETRVYVKRVGVLHRRYREARQRRLAAGAMTAGVAASH
ncbi:MAG TPA: lytic transglycosylase domain-containing protein [Rhodanobacteraceae bacterium]|nr:lytic transglycosylase domain-containing protein [Rhodanobacteraceae bacterium]